MAHTHDASVLLVLRLTAPKAALAYSVRLMALKFLGQDSGGSTADAIKCIEYALANGVNILSNNWGGGGFSQALRDAIEAAKEANIFFVAAAGKSF